MLSVEGFKAGGDFSSGATGQKDQRRKLFDRTERERERDTRDRGNEKGEKEERVGKVPRLVGTDECQSVRQSRD